MPGSDNGPDRNTPQGSLRDALKAVADEPAQRDRSMPEGNDDRTRIIRRGSGETAAAAAATPATAAPADAESTRLVERGGKTGAPDNRMGILKEALHAVESALGAAPAVLAAQSGATKSGANAQQTSNNQQNSNAAPGSGTAQPPAQAASLSTRHDTPPTVAIRGGGHQGKMEQAKSQAQAQAKTQMVRGQQRPTRTNFHAEPVVGWLVVIGGPGLGAFRPVFEGNNTIGRAASQRVPIDFGDDSISNEEQAYIRYDSADRTFLFVPNLAKTNVVAVNDAKPTSAVKLNPMDVVTMGTTQMVFVPFCGEEFDWSELADLDG